MNNTFETQVLEYCSTYDMFPQNASTGVLVALSGGGDSVALLMVLARNRDTLGFRIEAAHLNHALRDDDADRDADFCSDLCASLDIPLTVHKLRKGELAHSTDSIEASARDARIAFLEDTAAANGLNRIATGHTLDDQAETVLHRIIRGTGPAGIIGIRPMRDCRWIRPLLSLSRDAAREYLAAIGSGFREDATNSDPAFFRNRIRHELIPLLRERFSPGIVPALNRLAELTLVQEDYLDRQLEQAYHSARIVDNPYKIFLDKPTFTDYHKLIKQRIVRRCLERLEGAGRTTDFNEVERILSVIDAGSGTTEVTDTIRFGATRRFIAFTKRPAPYEHPVAVPGETIIPVGGGSIIARKPENTDVCDGRLRVLIDNTVVEQFGSLTVGPIRRGETMVPHGLTRKVKIRELASSAAIPLVVRDHLPVVRTGDEAIWIPGLKSSVHLAQRGAVHGGSAVMLEYTHGINWDALHEQG